LRRAEQTAAALARFVLGVQDEERRKIAKGLHDDIAQNLVAATWMTERLQGELPRARQANGRELEEVLQRSITDVRALSYLLHPPLLDEAGLESALRTRVDSYHKCSGIAVELEFAGKLGRLPPDVELTIFRLVEEALSAFGKPDGAHLH
jgi:signal transduction histidine kinase